ncbi:pyruvate kinase [Phaeovulum vinaykumarii]|uniref:pyruvate kinase n=2 Tax=Phaeovulum vinaykumarii TaxID=407234 RepID=A0A1N7MU37_9RHOB|nr:pyruvate kinase [Phaeovulum vinaykumarii]SOC18309.1 pyruvate kinase [Phaeovulum vinaykumarii]
MDGRSETTTRMNEGLAGGRVGAEADAFAARDLAEQLGAVAVAVARAEAARIEAWDGLILRHEFLPSAQNLAAWLALRAIDLRPLQPRLSALGLSSLGRCEGHVRASLDASLAALERVAGLGRPAFPDPRRFTEGQARITARRDALFGARVDGPGTRVLVTLPGVAAEAEEFVARLIDGGADAVRVNCAHDTPDAWAAMIGHVRRAGAQAGRRVPVLMDLPGPKLRLAAVVPAPGGAGKDRDKAQKSGPEKSGPEKTGKGKSKGKHKAHAAPPLTAEAGASTGGLPKLSPGDIIEIQAGAVPCAPRPAQGARLAATLSHPELFGHLSPGVEVSFDDGKLTGRVTLCEGAAARIEILTTRTGGARLKPGKGLNLPGVDLAIPAIGAQDLECLDFVVGHADMVGLSFAQTPADVLALIAAMEARADGRPLPAIVLKIETPLGLKNLPEMIVTAGGRLPVAVMIARGDLAVELGLARLSEIQEEILWLCEAAQVPVVWATQVLEGLLKDGQASRAETTDAAMSQRADCVMLNKGPHLLEGLDFLRTILMRMERHQDKKSPRLGALGLWTRG